MRASGNGKVAVCVNNLLHMFRTENPFERLKGLDATLIDRPTETVKGYVRQDVEWQIRRYEPRAQIEDITVTLNEGGEGDLKIAVKLKGEGEVTNG